MSFHLLHSRLLPAWLLHFIKSILRHWFVELEAKLADVIASFKNAVQQSDIVTPSSLFINLSVSMSGCREFLL